jgi:hypothetical protein
MTRKSQIIVRLQAVGMAGLAALAIVVMSWWILQQQAAADWSAMGEGGCGVLSDALSRVSHGDTIMIMLAPRNSEGVVITKNITLQGGWSHGTNDCAGKADQVLTNTSGFTFHAPYSRSGLFHFAGNPVLMIGPQIISLTIQHLSLDQQGGPYPPRGGSISGIISNSAQVRLENLEIPQGGAVNAGGAMYLDVRGGSKLVISDSLFLTNTATTGGGLELHISGNSQAHIHHSVFRANSASGGNGGGARVVITSGHLTITNSLFDNNAALAGRGGGLAIEKRGTLTAYVTLINNTFSSNQAQNNADLYITGTNLITRVLTPRALLPLVMNQTYSGPFVEITNITLSGSTYVVSFQTFNFQPEYQSGQLHLHFFFNTVPPSQAGMPGAGPWKIYPTTVGGAAPSPFTGYTVGERPGGATQLCVLAANYDHSVQLNTGNCFNLP